jgi:hypothetical protein
MITHIDVSSLLRRRVSELYSHLVTRSTGAAVRSEIERELEDCEGDVTILDFTHVGLLDFSCADEVVAKLLLRSLGPDLSSSGRYFVFRGMNDSHLYAIEAVLERHRLALLTELPDGEVQLVGDLKAEERKTWEAVNTVGHAPPDSVASSVGISTADAERILEDLCSRRLLRRRGGEYAAVRLPC